MKEKIISRLVSIKSIVTLTLTLVFAYLSVRGTVSAENFLTIFTTIIAFYFGSQSEKQKVQQNAQAEPEIEKGIENGNG